MYFTKNDIKQLLDVLKLNSKKDTEFEVANDLVGDENIALIQKGENKISTLNHLSSFVLKNITYDLNAEKIARENADEVHDKSLKTLNSSVNTIIEDIGNIIEDIGTINNSITNQGKEITELQTEVDEQVGQILTISTNLINVNESVNTHTTEIATLKSNSVVDLGEVSTSGAAESMFGSKEYLTNSSQIFKYKVTDKDGAICLSIPLSGGRWRQFLFVGRNSFYRTVDKDYNVGTWNSLIVDNLNTSDIYSMLSANQGKVLNNKITALQTKVQDVIVVNEEQYTTITSQGNRITETEHRIDEHTTQLELLYSDFVLMQQTIQDLTARIEALENYHSTSVQNGTLSASASVVNDVMSVQGSVKDGILKLN